MIKDISILALGNLKHRGIRSWLTILGIFIGIAAVVALISLGNGLKMAVNSQFGISSTEVITVQAGGLNSYGPPGSGAATPLDKKDLRAIKRISTVERAINRNVETAKVEFNKKAIFRFAGNVLDGDDRKFIYEALDINVLTGRLLRDGDTNKVVLGYNYYIDKVGFDKIIKPGDKIDIQGKSFDVVGIMEKKGSFIFDNIILMNDKPLNDLMGYGDNIDIIVAKVKDKSLMDKTKVEIEKALRKTRDVKVGEENFEVSTPDAALGTVNQVLTGVQIFIFIIALMSIIVGSIGIVNTMTTAVLERRKEIGIMKSIGATNTHIFLMFFVESGFLGLIGGIIGALFGVGIGYLGIVAIDNFVGGDMKPTIDFVLISIALIGSFLVGSIAGITPAMSAARQNPVEALRG